MLMIPYFLNQDTAQFLDLMVSMSTPEIYAIEKRIDLNDAFARQSHIKREDFLLKLFFTARLSFADLVIRNLSALNDRNGSLIPKPHTDEDLLCLSSKIQAKF